MAASQFIDAAPPAVVTGWIGHWSPGIGDPTPVGWLTVVAYALAAWQCLRLARSTAVPMPGREAALWWMLGIGLCALCVNKQLDLQSALTEIGRVIARYQGWYAERREVQREFMIGIAGVATLAMVALGLLARRAPRPTLLALSGSVCLLAFIVIRAASFHHFDRFIGSAYLGLRANWILELGGIGIILAGARWRRAIAPTAW